MFITTNINSNPYSKIKPNLQSNTNPKFKSKIDFEDIFLKNATIPHLHFIMLKQKKNPFSL